MYKFITNPKTNRRVKITGRIGKRVFRNYLKYLNEGQIGGFYNGNPNDDNRYYHQFYSYFNNTFISYINNDRVKRFCRHLITSNRDMMEAYIRDEAHGEDDPIRKIYLFILTMAERHNINDNAAIAAGDLSNYRRFLTFEIYNSKFHTVLNYLMNLNLVPGSLYGETDNTIPMCKTIPYTNDIEYYKDELQPPPRVFEGWRGDNYIEYDGNPRLNNFRVRHAHGHNENVNRLGDFDFADPNYPSSIFNLHRITEDYIALHGDNLTMIENGGGIAVNHNSINDGLLYKNITTPVLDFPVLNDIVERINTGGEMAENWEHNSNKFSLFYNHHNNSIILSIEGSTFANLGQDWTENNMDSSIGVIIVDREAAAWLRSMGRAGAALTDDALYWGYQRFRDFTGVCRRHRGLYYDPKVIPGDDVAGHYHYVRKEPIYVYGGFLTLAQELFYGHCGLFYKSLEKPCGIIASDNIVSMPLLDINDTRENKQRVMESLLGLANNKDIENRAGAGVIEEGLLARLPILNYYRRIREILPENKRDSLKFTIQGHSLAGATSHLLYILMKNCPLYREMMPNTQVITYSAPKTILNYSKPEYDRFMGDDNNKIINIFDSRDIVPKIPLTCASAIHIKRIRNAASRGLQGAASGALRGLQEGVQRSRRDLRMVLASTAVHAVVGAVSGVDTTPELAEGAESVDDHIEDVQYIYFHPGTALILDNISGEEEEEEEGHINIDIKATHDLTYAWDIESTLRGGWDVIGQLWRTGRQNITRHQYNNLYEMVHLYLAEINRRRNPVIDDEVDDILPPGPLSIGNLVQNYGGAVAVEDVGGAAVAAAGLELHGGSMMDTKNKTEELSEFINDLNRQINEGIEKNETIVNKRSIIYIIKRLTDKKQINKLKRKYKITKKDIEGDKIKLPFIIYDKRSNKVLTK
jgi:hypothetical protein